MLCLQFGKKFISLRMTKFYVKSRVFITLDDNIVHDIMTFSSNLSNDNANVFQVITNCKVYMFA